MFNNNAFVSKNKKLIINIFVFVFLLSLSFSLVNIAGAQVDVGINEVGNDIVLSASDPRTTAARIINIVMLSLGVIAVGLIVYAGFLWMTSNGEEEKVEKARNILKNGIIGLVIILSAWGIASFILSRLIRANNGSGASGSCSSGQSLSCGCGGSMSCIEGSWGPCLGSSCNSGSGPASCDSSPLGGCQAEDQICAGDSFCNVDTCACVPKGELGDSCDADPNTSSCDADNNRCAEYLSCNPDSCTCYGPPVITEISPIGGFCNEDKNKSCSSNDDCSLGCNLQVPNGAADNIITISGTNFGQYDSLSSKVVFGGDAVGVNPTAINPECIDSWTNNQIIVAIPDTAVSGPIKVVTADNQSDSTDDSNGPELEDFVANDIVRPGLCLLTPDSGLLSQQVNYKGINLYGGEAYFGNYEKNVRGLASDFVNPAGLAGTTTIPNVNKGKMSSFVVASIGGNSEKSNYVKFVKQEEADAGPYISYFEPAGGRAGQYVTIHGSGFGGTRGSSQVFFGDKEADYSFPEACANSVWREHQIIVKVPADLADGNYEIKVKLGDNEINSRNSNPNVFSADASLSLKTSICKIFPTRGQIGTPVEIWGEYFGEKGGNALTVFSYNRSVSGQIDIDRSAQKLNPKVPENAVTGSVKVVKNSEWGNDVNFEIGACVDNSDCSGDVCCPANTYKQGRCAASLAECYIDIPNSVFEWSFSTGFGGVGNNNEDFDSCQGMAQSLGACQVGAFCPNSPGLCSPYAGGVKVLGSCDDSCSGVGACAGLSGKKCVYEKASDKCFIDNGTCSLNSNFNYVLGEKEFSSVKTCQQYPQFGNQSHWEIKTSSSCPAGWTRLDGGRCVDSVSATSSSCSLCPDGFTCQQIGELGRCVTAELCPGSAKCNDSSCVSDTSARCDCCCEIGQDARDCCAPLTCTGTCGSDTSDDKAGLGQCSGCTVDKDGNGDISASEQLLSDQACNCSSHSGKYCDISVPTGACLDCSRLSAESCLEHSQSCCLDSKGTATKNDDVCRGGNGQAVSADPTNADFGYCAYFDCQSASSTPPGDPGLCASSTPKVFGLFKSVESCTDNCAAQPGLSFCGQHDGDSVGCAAASGCCFNFSDQKCNSGEQMFGGYCAYYDCQAAPNADKCENNPSTVGSYNSKTACDIGCSQPPLGGLGKDCRNLTTSLTAGCNQSFCASPFACLNSSGASGTPGDCGTCCCQVSNPNSCAGIGSGSLVCQPNQAPCSGEDRGLCCGCSQDQDCGNADTLGCDSGTCCRARPAVLSDKVSPAHGAVGVCRNASIRVPFDQLMDTGSLMNNILLLEEHDYGSGVCPSGTFLASAGDFLPRRDNWLARTYNKAVLAFNSVLVNFGLSSSPVLAINIPSSSKLYCSVPGIVSVINDGNGSVAEFSPKKLLSPASNYYLVVKGDESLDSNAGVLSQWQIGLNGQGYLDLNANTYIEGENIRFNNLIFKNAYIFGFTTLAQQGSNAGICAVDYVATEPASYLFQNTDNDSNEDDMNPQSNSFDTKNDRDKLFTANAYSADDQLLHPISGYYWDWSWQSAKPSIASIASLGGLPGNQALVVAANGVSDDSTVLSARIDMNRFSSPGCNSSPSCVCAEPDCLNNCCNVYQDGDGMKAETPLFIFLCKNPWPAVNPDTLNWSPWYDNCTGAIGNCTNYNYKFYYCRDAGSEGISDDLPAMINPAVIRGTGNAMICSEGQKACNTLGSTCGPDNNYDGIGDGFCIWSVLKESYFFKEATPGVGAITAAIDQENGGAVKLEWYGDSGLIYNPNQNLMGKYRVYYAPVTSGQMSFVDVKPNDAYAQGAAGTVCTPAVPTGGENYSCRYLLPGLQAGENYSFKVSAISSAQVEGPLSGEQTAFVSDKIAPAAPQGLAGTIAGSQRVHFTWQLNGDDASFYRLYHGVNSGQYGESYDSDKGSSALDIDLRKFSPGIHYFALSALDDSNNESNKSAQITLVIPAS